MLVGLGMLDETVTAADKIASSNAYHQRHDNLVA